MNGELLQSLIKEFDLDTIPPAEVAAITLAYVGDAVYEVVTRTIVTSGGNRRINAIHKDNVKYVSAVSQAKIADFLEDKLSEEELEQYRRGKNAKTATSAKNASLTQYHKATGFEALIGFLFLSKKNERILELCKLGFKELGLLKE